MSPSATLFWGYDLGDLTDRETYEDLRPAWMQEGEDVEERLALQLGWVEVPFPEGIVEPYWSLPTEERERIKREQRATLEYRAWSDNLSEMRRLAEQVPVQLGRYGYIDGDSVYYVGVKASVQEADDWGSIELKPLEVAPGWAEQLAEFMRLLELPVPDGTAPAWHMNCYYG